MKSAAIDVKTFAQASADLKAVLDTATQDSMPVVISRDDGEPAVVISLDSWNRLQEAAAVLNETPSSRKALDEAIAELDAGGGIETELGPDGFYHPVRRVAAE